MSGKYKGCHTVLKETFPHLPDLGGCEAHDACNIIKHGVKKMMPEIIKLYSCIWANLEKHSAKKHREFKEMCEELGHVHRHTPKFIEVRFRYVVLLAEYMEQNDRPLYVYYSNLADQFRKGKELSETEMMILEIYLKNYLMVRLVNKFLVSVGKPFVEFIDFFESREVRVQHRFEKMLLLLTSHLSSFLKNGGFDKEIDVITAKEALDVDFKNSSKYLPKADVLVGADVKDFIKKMGLAPNSPELTAFYSKVFDFYTESSEFMIKYFRAGLTSKTLQYLSVLSPNAKNLDLDTARKRWLYLAEKFPNIISEHEAEDLRSELVAYRQLPDPDDMEDIPPDEWFARVAAMSRGGEKCFPVLSKLALGLCTIYNSSSETERDFSLQNLLLADTKRHSMSQTKLQSYLAVISHAGHLSKVCERCRVADDERKARRKAGETGKRVQTSHCHCSFLRPDEDLLSKLRSSEPAQRFAKRKKEKKVKDLTEEQTKEELKKKDLGEAQEDFKREVRKLKRKIQEQAVIEVKSAKQPKIASKSAGSSVAGKVGVIFGKALVTTDKTVAAAGKTGATATKAGVTAAKAGAAATKAGTAGKAGATATKAGVTARKTGIGAGVSKRVPIKMSKKATKREEDSKRLEWIFTD